MKVGERIKEQRKLKGMTQNKLAELCNVARGTIQQYESNRRQPHINQLKIIALALAVPISNLVDTNDIIAGEANKTTPEIGEKIRAKRKEKGLTQKELGELCGMSENLIGKYELGVKNPKIVTLKKIALALDVKTPYFLEIEPDEATIFEKMIGNEYKMLQNYADAFEMSIGEMIAMSAKQIVENAKARLLDKDPQFVNETLAKLKALDESKKKGDS